MVAEISLLTFWAAFLALFGAAKTRQASDGEERLARALTARPEPARAVSVAYEESPRARRFRERLLLAGLHRKSDLDRALFWSRLCLLVPLLAVCVLFFMRFPAPQIAAAGALFGAIFVLVPRLMMLRAIFRRRRELERHLAGTLDLLVLCLEAGLSFDSSLVRVAEEQRRVSTQISRELLFTNQEILAGRSREEALRNLAWRAGVEDLRAILAAVLQSIKMGTSLVKTLRTQAEVLRKKRRERIRACILKTPVKLIFPLLFFIFPTLLIVILAPSFVNIFRHLLVSGV